MIKYTLRCAAGHEYDAWFAGIAAFETLVERGHLVCEVCGSADVERAPMAPAVARRDQSEARAKSTGGVSNVPLADETWSNRREMLQKLEALRAEVLAKSEYVGPRFAEEARIVHEATEKGETPRSIYGEASADEVNGLLDDGILVAPIPKLPGDGN